MLTLTSPKALGHYARARRLTAEGRPVAAAAALQLALDAELAHREATS